MQPMVPTGAGIHGVFQTHTSATMAVPGFATFGYFTDPSGTVMGLIG
jgi:hypothetical protein